jgi:hypothetical protein
MVLLNKKENNTLCIAKLLTNKEYVPVYIYLIDDLQEKAS